jgi:hypothetical protein
VLCVATQLLYVGVFAVCHCIALLVQKATGGLLVVADLHGQSSLTATAASINHSHAQRHAQHCVHVQLLQQLTAIR